MYHKLIINRDTGRYLAKPIDGIPDPRWTYDTADAWAVTSTTNYFLVMWSLASHHGVTNVMAVDVPASLTVEGNDS